MDIQMPNMNGYDATRTIRALPDSEKANIPILAMTANAFEEDKRDAYRSGMNGHVAKPINVRELMKELANILG
ncbi:MAG: response regulator [Anaerotignum sp.]